MIGPRNGDAPEHDSGGPGAHARFALAWDRLAAADEERSRWLAEKCRAMPKQREEESCAIDGCEKPAAYKGVCKAHYQAEWRKAQPKRVGPKEKPERCRRGHLFDATRIDRGHVYQVCRQCRRIRERAQRARLKAAG